MVFVSGEFARELEEISDGQIITKVMDMLTRIYGDKVKQPQGSIITRWGQDLYSLGSYPVLSVGATYDSMSEISEPVDNLLFFAGDGTSKNFTSTVHGAYISGKRAAKQVLKSLSEH